MRKSLSDGSRYGNACFDGRLAECADFVAAHSAPGAAARRYGASSAAFWSKNPSGSNEKPTVSRVMTG
jgi:hypothetical protein